jgi:hypothetical protein
LSVHDLFAEADSTSADHALSNAKAAKAAV